MILSKNICYLTSLRYTFVVDVAEPEQGSSLVGFSDLMSSWDLFVIFKFGIQLFLITHYL